MDETEFPNFFKVFCIHFLDDAVVSTHTVSCKYAFSRFKVSKGVSDLAPPLPICMFFCLFGDVSNI